MRGRLVSTLLSLAGGLVGGALGYWVFFWLVRHEFYGLIVPGALVGLGSGLLSRRRSKIRGVVCGLAGLGFGLYADWGFEAFRDDPGFGYFVAHIHQLGPVTLLMLGLGGVMAFWLGKDASPLAILRADAPVMDTGERP